ncbi:MAG: o-succinylbenzoate--CoA ligase [Bacillaceae bacterium]|uniref:o-succinylbenzoate--CoA ligase n=1 Tax=Aeribacillus TaxID=1055323 RepID=UPI0007B49229|nr:MULTISPECIES: o-succinylbenzoate--CoA ligase [Aeribacillus]KZM55042.1 2-succinylbenzoate-CoA ligase [Aeribacillus pallidus]MED0651656.1 o-succinylbenzoate--CoA ligase [Aeribacillus composti]MED4485216.1 o-succinylbenzoate--CoA ligase [Aeribacillus pallidus]REJ25612.1 MAG: o-succinylbenzoate--CoA ligase [Bacillaceae bacterium]
MSANRNETPNWLKQRAFLTPDRLAIRYEGKNYSFLDLHQLVEKRARQLHQIDIKRGDTVGLLMKNSLEMVINIHALMYLGAVNVLLNTRLTAEELLWQINDANIKCVICDDELSVHFPGKKVMTLSELKLCDEKEAALDDSFILDDVATIMYTSGTTGKPKGVQQTFGNHWWSAIGSVLNLGLKDGDCWLLAVPLFHISGLSILMRSVIYGIGIVLHSSFSAKEANRAIKNEGVTIASVVTAMLNDMLQELGSDTYPKSFRCMLLGGGPAPRPILEQCREKEIPVFQTYGMTETCSQIATLAPEFCFSKLGSAGKPLFPAQIRIVADGRDCSPNEEGEIVVKGPNVTPGYLHRPDATNEAIRDGWFYTGDLGYLDEEGFLYVLDRRSDLIVSGGENIYPAEVEAVILSHPSVKDVGVVGKENKKWGKVPHAFVVRSEEVSEEELRQFCLKKLAKYKVPKGFTFVESLPRNASKKLLRRKLKEWL